MNPWPIIMLVGLATAASTGCSEKVVGSGEGPQVRDVARAALAATAAPVTAGRAGLDEPTVASAGGVARVQGQVPADRNDYLATEARFIQAGSLSVPTVAEVMGSDRFDAAVEAFDRDMAKDPQAQDLAALYGRGIRDALAEGRLDHFACGTSLCIGVIRTSGPVAYDAWLDAFSKDRRVPTYSFVEKLETHADHHEYRFIFSTDPATNSVSDRWRP